MAVAIFLLILVILHGTGCFCSDSPHKMTVQKTLEAPAAAAVADASNGTSDASSAPVPAVTTVTPAPAGSSVVDYEFAAPQKSDGTSAAAAAIAGGSPPLAKEYFDPIAMVRSAIRSDGKFVKPVPNASASVIKTERDLAGLFQNRAERMCGERLQVSPETEAKFVAEKLSANLFPRGLASHRKKETSLKGDPLFPSGMARRHKSKKYEKEAFVDANGRWQSFMYYHVGNDGDPRALGDYVDVAEVPHVEHVNDGVSLTGDEVALRKSRERFAVPPMLSNFAANTRSGVQQAWSDATGRPLGPSPLYVVSPKKEHLASGVAKSVKAPNLSGPHTIRTPDGRCLGVVGGRDGTQLTVNTCQPTAGDNMQSWDFGASGSRGDYQIRASSHGGDSYCMTSLPDGELQLMPCLGVPQHRWSLPGNQLKNQRGQCMTITDGALGSTPKVGSCAGPQAQWKY